MTGDLGQQTEEKIVGGIGHELFWFVSMNACALLSHRNAYIERGDDQARRRPLGTREAKGVQGRESHNSEELGHEDSGLETGRRRIGVKTGVRYSQELFACNKSIYP